MIRILPRYLLLIALLSLLSCQPVDRHVLKLGANNWFGYQPFFAAQTAGYFDKKQISVIELGSATEVLRALYNGSIDVAALTLDEALSALSLGKNLVVVMVIDFSYGGDTLIAKSSLETLKDLKGKSIAVENTALGALMLDAVLKKANLELDDVIVKSVAFNLHEDALARNKFDAVITFEPVKTKLLAQGYRELFNSREIPNTIVDVLVVREESLIKYPEKIRQLVTGFFRARELIARHDSSVIDLIAKRVDLKTDAVIQGYEQLKMPDLTQNRELMALCEAGFNGVVDKIITIMLERGMIKNKVDLSNRCDASIVQGVTI